ncbi:MAG: FAD-dependent oxidoreductase [Woeseiaceae bacterium]|nr:FAD-dependent oxidoreductase [Woeseiaceae bacterium]NIP20295.1 FAD-dependent oxidoreductase [Woeseiaceae bacterium]NIS89168.1 FAD-dependent oxidoreductase [Woeseiaceae bacterium]
MPKSLWAATTARPEPYPLLRGRIDADVCIVGGGIMGVSAALALAEKGVSVAVLEAAEIGWGASGRNNGLVAPGLKRDPCEVRELLGEERGNRLLRYSGDAPNRVFELINEHRIDCDANPGGWIQAANSRRALRRVERRVSEWQALGVDVGMIAPNDLDANLGTGFYSGACRYANGGSINPLAYTHGLAQAAAGAGARLFEQSPATRTERQSQGWIIGSTYGVVVAPWVLYCTNAYNDSHPRLHGTVIPLRTAQVASHRLPQGIAGKILPGAAAASDTQRLLTSFRVTADNRLVMGGASATAGDEHPGLVRQLHRAAADRFPELGPVQWEYGWSGYLALTPDHLPEIIKIDDGFLAPVGCNGRGIAMATVMGQTLAEIVCGADENDCNVPVKSPKPVPGFGLRYIGIAAAVRLNRFLDSAERRLWGR